MYERPYGIVSPKIEYDLEDDTASNSFIQELVPAFEAPVEYLNLKHDKQLLIPVSLFSGSLAPLQALVKYLKEDRNLSNSTISHLIGRDIRCIWLTYRSVEKKQLVFSKHDSVLIPIQVFENEDLSVLESLVAFLLTNRHTISEISKLLAKDYRTIWTVKARARRKISAYELKKN